MLSNSKYEAEVLLRHILRVHELAEEREGLIEQICITKHYDTTTIFIHIKYAKI